MNHLELLILGENSVAHFQSVGQCRAGNSRLKESKCEVDWGGDHPK